MEFDATFIEGVAAVAASVIVFCGSVWLLLSMVMGARLAYFVTATVTLGFLVMMGIVWSLPAANPLGPVGRLPEWDPVAIAQDASELDFPAADEYPESPWRPVNQQDEAELTKAAELGTGATDFLESAVQSGRVPEAAQDNAPNSETVRFLEQGGQEYGAISIEPAQGNAPGVVAVLRYDPGNPLGQARMILLGTVILFVGHLVGLSRSEKRARRLAEAQAS